MSNVLRGFSDATTAVVQAAAQRVVAVNGRDWGGSSGIIVKPGVVVTAEEGLERDDEIDVILPDGKEAKATVAGRDPTTDVAVLRVSGAGLAEPKAAALPLAGAIVIGVGRVGKVVVAALGSIALVGEAWRSSQGGLIDARIRVDITLRRATEGGALVDAEGNLVGMAVFGPRRQVLAIPHSTVMRATEHILLHGSVVRGYVGVHVQPVAADAGSPAGAIVVGLDPEGPAKKAGIIIGDVVLTWDGEPVNGTRTIIEKLGPTSVGQSAKLGLSRAGKAVEVSITVAPRPSA
jgi:S1-C subfamily serine protease